MEHGSPEDVFTTLKMGIFHCYVSLPKGIPIGDCLRGVMIISLDLLTLTIEPKASQNLSNTKDGLEVIGKPL